MFDATETQFGGVDVLVNNAGILLQSNIADTSDSDFDKLVTINLKGTFNGLREAAKRSNGGRIINFSTSLVGSLMPGYGIYAATKAAVETMTSIRPRSFVAGTSPSMRFRRARPQPTCS